MYHSDVRVCHQSVIGQCVHRLIFSHKRSKHPIMMHSIILQSSSTSHRLELMSSYIFMFQNVQIPEFRNFSIPNMSSVISVVFTGRAVSYDTPSLKTWQVFIFIYVLFNMNRSFRASNYSENKGLQTEINTITCVKVLT